MFPNVRLLIGALFITVLVLSCEFGVFAALRVNREPLSRLTSESAPLQLVAGKNAALAVPISWSAPRNAQTATDGMQTGAIIVEVPAAQPAERAIETLGSSNDGATGTLNTDNQTNPAVLQTALAPSPAAAAPIADAAPIAEAPNPLQETPAPAAAAAAGNAPPEQTAAAPVALAAASPQQTPVAEIVKPAEAAPPQAASALQPQETAAQAGEPQASSAPLIAAAPGVAEPAAARPAEVTGSVPNAAMPETAAPKAEAPHAKPSPKIVHKPAAKKPHKTARAPAPPHHPVKKRIARAHPAAAAAAAQPVTDFNNPVFQSAPAFQRPTKSRPGAKKTVTNNGFNTFGTFGTQFGTQ